MKNYLIILGFILFTFNTLAEAKVQFYQSNPYYRIHQRPVYNPYNSNNLYYRPYRNSARYYDNKKRIQRIDRIRKLNRIKNNFLTWNFNRNNNGNLTGYSTPITKDVYKNLGNDFWDKEFIKTPSVNCNTDIFSTPASGSSYYGQGRIRRGIDGISNKTGVTIIYD